MDWTKIILAALTIISALVSGFLIPWLKSKMTAEQLSALDFWLRVLVAAAETAFGTGKGAEKKAWVLARIRGMGLKFDDQAVSDAVEAMVRELTAQAVINTGGAFE